MKRALAVCFCFWVEAVSLIWLLRVIFTSEEFTSTVLFALTTAGLVSLAMGLIIKFGLTDKGENMKQGDRIRIYPQGLIGTVISANNYGTDKTPNWYIEMQDDHYGYAYWKQLPDGGYVEVLGELVQVERRLMQRVLDYIEAQYSGGDVGDDRLEMGDNPLLDELYEDVKEAVYGLS